MMRASDTLRVVLQERLEVSTRQQATASAGFLPFCRGRNERNKASEVLIRDRNDSNEQRNEDGISKFFRLFCS